LINPLKVSLLYQPQLLVLYLFSVDVSLSYHS